MTDTKECTECFEEKPVSKYHRNVNSKDGRAHICEDCVDHRGTAGYVDEDVSKETPARSSSDLIEHYNLSDDHVDAAEAALEAIRERYEWYHGDRPRRETYGGESGLEVIEDELPDAHPRIHAAVGDVAIALAWEEGMDLASRASAPKAAQPTEETA